MSDINVRVSSDTSQFQRGVSQMQNSISGLKNSVSLLNTAILSIGAGKMISFGTSLIQGASEAAASVETLNIQLKVLTGNANIANKLAQDITTYAKVTPFETGDIQQAVKMLLQFGIASSDVMNTVRMLGDVSGGSGEKLLSIARAFGQLSSTGKATMEDINQMIDAGFNPLSIISEKTGTSMMDLRQRVSDGEVSVKMISDAFVTATSKGGRFYGMLSEMSNTTEGKLSNLKDTITQLKIAFGAPFNVGLKAVLDSLTNNLPKFTEMFQKIGQSLQPILGNIAIGITDALNTFDKTFKQAGYSAAISELISNAIKSPAIRSAISQLANIFAIAFKETMLGIWTGLPTEGKVAVGGTAAVAGGYIFKKITDVLLTINKVADAVVGRGAATATAEGAVTGAATRSLGTVLADYALPILGGAYIGDKIGTYLKTKQLEKGFENVPWTKSNEEIIKNLTKPATIIGRNLTLEAQQSADEIFSTLPTFFSPKMREPSTVIPKFLLRPTEKTNFPDYLKAIDIAPEKGMGATITRSLTKIGGGGTIFSGGVVNAQREANKLLNKIELNTREISPSWK